MSFGLALGFPRSGAYLLEWAVKALFADGQQGAWYDPQDLSTLYADSAGTTPVAMPGQGSAVTAGLQLDKSKGLVLGPELVTNGGFDSTDSWTTFSGVTIAGGVVTFDGSAGVNPALRSNSVTNTALTPGKTYKLVFDITSPVTAASGAMYIYYNQQTIYTLYNGYTGRKEAYFVAVSGTGGLTFSQTLGMSGAFDNISVRELPGNHRFQTTAIDRPALSARYNLLTYTEQFDNAAWAKAGIAAFGSGSIANAATAPDGTLTADKVVASNTASSTRAVYASFSPTSGATYKISVCVKAAEYTKFAITEIGGGRFGARFDLVSQTATSLGGTGFVAASITNLGSGWFRCEVQASAAASGWAVSFIGYPDSPTSISPAGVSYAGDGTSGIYLWGADLRAANEPAGLPPYQRVVDSLTYDTAGFPLYLQANGSNTWMQTNSIDFSASDKMFVAAGVRKIGTRGTVVELSADANTNNGAFRLGLGSSVDSDALGYTYWSRGTNTQFANSPANYPVPGTAVLSGLSDISGDSAVLRINGAQAASSATDQGTGNFGNYPLYFYRRGGTSLPFNGRDYGMIIRGGTLPSAAQIAQVERYLSNKIGGGFV